MLTRQKLRPRSQSNRHRKVAFDFRRSLEIISNAVHRARALVDTAHIARHRLYCDTLKFWRFCPLRACKRHRRCVGEPTGCLVRGLPAVPQASICRHKRR